MRKSSLKTFATETLLSSDDVPEGIRTNAHTCTDGTIKGIRAGLTVTEAQRCGLVSDEITNTYGLGNSDTTGLHMSNKNKLCTWLNAEKDIVKTRHGTTMGRRGDADETLQRPNTRRCDACSRLFVPVQPHKCLCGATRYCGASCQIDHWPTHKMSCSCRRVR